MSLLKEHRGAGVGTRLILTLLERLRFQGYNKVSLSVQKENYAVKLYKKVGFEIVNETDEEYIMICKL